jgi:hypothetical protein
MGHAGHLKDHPIDTAQCRLRSHHDAHQKEEEMTHKLVDAGTEWIERLKGGVGRIWNAIR